MLLARRVLPRLTSLRAIHVSSARFQQAAAAVDEETPEATPSSSHVKPPATPQPPLPQPNTDEQKQYSARIMDIVERVASLSLLEASELNEALRDRLKLPDTAGMMMGAMPVMGGAAKGADEEEAAPVQQKTAFSVKLVKFDDTKKIPLIKEIKTLVPGLNLVQAKKFVESVPKVLKEDLGKDEAEKLKTQIEALGGSCEIV